MAWLPGWAKRVKLTIDQTDIDANLSNFPILLYISASSGRLNDNLSFIFTEIGSDGNRKKIAVTTADGTTQCYVEIEKWDDVNEQAWLWVKVPSVAADVDTDLYLYYDSTQADNDNYVGDTNSTPAETVWDANFVAVYHKADGVDTSHIYDSTNNNQDGTKKAAAEPAVTTSGKIANAQEYDGINDYIALPNLGTFNAFTFSIWVKLDTLPGADEYDGILGNLGWEAGNLHCNVGPSNSANSNQIEVAEYPVPPRVYLTFVPTTGVWYQLTYTRTTSGTARLYCDAVLKDDDPTNANNLNLDDWRIGNVYDATRWLDGCADELRISNVERNSAWIRASYESEIDDLLDWGSEETPPRSFGYIIG